MEHAVTAIIDNLQKLLYNFYLKPIKKKTYQVHTFTDKRSPLSSTHLKNFPPKNCTPIIENINQNTRQTSRTLKIDGIAYIRAFTTI